MAAMLRLACFAGFLAAIYGDIIIYSRDATHVIEEEFRDMPASFGGDIPSEGLQGLLVVGDPADGCKPLNKPPVAENFTGKWIVLLARYNCSFEVKVRNAQLAGYKCAIVHNVNSSSLETMSAKNAQDIVIPSVFVSDLAGEILEQAYSYTSGYFVMVNGDLPFDINTHLLLPFAIVVVLCLLVILVFMIVKCIKDRRRARRHRLPNRCLKKIPTCKFSKGDPYDTCAICLDDYQEGERLRVLPCAHAYHAKCIDPWLTQNRRVCPVCKRRVLAAGERRRRHSDTESDDTEPLVTSGQGQSHGTFEEQSENPFSRAARYVSRLRDNLRRPNDAETPAAAEGDASNEPDEAPPSDVEAPADTAPLLARARRERARTRARARSASASINGDQGEIGVAALPVTPQPVAPPPHVDL